MVHHVAEVSPRLRNLIIRKQKIFLPFIAISVKDFIVVPKCLKCQDLGHIDKHCTSKSSNCAHCGEQGHERKECEKKDKNPVCPPCLARKKKCNKMGSHAKECETYKLLLQRENDKTDYGQ